MNSEAPQPEAYAWIWLPGAVEPVVAGRLAAAGPELHFNYGRSYLSRPDAISLYEPELPLRPGVLPLAKGLSMPGCIRDAAPDAWGRRVIVNKLTGARRVDIETERFDELTFLLESGSDRIGALDFQVSPDRYTPREAQAATLEELMDAARRVEEGVPMTPELERALLHGSSIGGARPKALIVDGDRKLIAKFSSQSDIFNVVKAEFVAMRLAACAGLKVAPVQLVKAAARDVLLVERFDRTPAEAGWARRAIVSALTLFSLDEMMARYASYEDLCEIIRCRFVDPKDTLRELFGRLVFNILCGNTDDHARNHAAFWNGHELSLTPAYDICPQPRAGNEATQAMKIVGDDRMSRLSTCLAAAKNFLMSQEDATRAIERQIRAIRANWSDVCSEAQLSDVEERLLRSRQFLNPFAFEGAPTALQAIAAEA